jgi:hypothetical protein
VQDISHWVEPGYDDKQPMLVLPPEQFKELSGDNPVDLDRNVSCPDSDAQHARKDGKK